MIGSCRPCISVNINTYARRRFNKLVEKHRSFFSGHHLLHTSASKSAPVQSQNKSNIEYCVDLVRKSDYENYLATLLLPKNVQRAAFALRAFNVELAQVRDVVSDKTIGLMRMQFWKDSMSRIFQGDPPQTPVAVELAGVCGFYKLSKRWMERIVEARALQLNRDSFLSIKEAEEYAEHSNSSLTYLLLECSGIKNVQADHAASHLGKAQGLVTLVRAVPYHAARRSVLLPMEILAKHKVSQEDVIRGKDAQPVKDVIFDIASVAHQHLEKARSLRSDLPDKCYTVFLNAAVCDHYLKALQQADFNVFDGKLQQRNHLLAYSMFFNKLRKRF
ncbi:NADH dehydrogenase (ubiquinone) complex I, assembly factor 6 [Aplysia californica]|uniref:15-cis-phytoene synthase n=1 Tax=Aplysia californica TaxID=6500 RepID=A0ABM0JPV9_APLCA|nr:NADH dehydrogenase (ubiquinone) complex I, assembly factor 6 [Aplysia californica]